MRRRLQVWKRRQTHDAHSSVLSGHLVIFKSVRKTLKWDFSQSGPVVALKQNYSQKKYCHLKTVHRKRSSKIWKSIQKSSLIKSKTLHDFDKVTSNVFNRDTDTVSRCGISEETPFLFLTCSSRNGRDLVGWSASNSLTPSRRDEQVVTGADDLNKWNVSSRSCALFVRR